MKLETPISEISHIAKKLDKTLKKLGIRCVQDLFFYLPFRYEDYSKCKMIDDLEVGEVVTVRGKVEIIESRRLWKNKTNMTDAIVTDESGRLKVIWFGQPFIKKIIKPGDTIYLSGKISDGKMGLQMTSPNYEKETGQKARGEKETTHTARIIPMYHLTSGISHKQLRFLTKQIIDKVDVIEEWLPESILEKADLIPLADAVRGVHFPVDEVDLKQSERRLKFGELYIMQLRSEMIRQSLKRSNAIPLKFQEKDIKEFVRNLPFELTKAQKVSTWEILKDLENTEPMNRLLEGDVGSGKTVVAAINMYNTILNKNQTVIMAPTEILAKQHYDGFVKLLGDKAKISIFTRTQSVISGFESAEKTKAGQKREVIKKIKEGEVDVVVGTHALLSDKVEFKNLGLVIVDEQHRFGVEQRKTISEKSGDENTMPHFLSMTATPIPRSFALTLYGDLDLSIINQLPQGRKPIETKFVPPNKRTQAYKFIETQVGEGRQVFVICPLIENEDSEKKSVMSEYEKLSKEIFPKLKVGFLHGKMPARGGSALGGKSRTKEDVMNDFSNGNLDILVATSVIEVGVDIPNASVMMIEGAERFGLAQLHQFRGRVGRSVYQSYCFLFTDTDNDKALERLAFFSKNTDGFKVAEYDLETRGPGEVYGKNQSGSLGFRMATLQDMDLIKLSRDLAKGTDFEQNPALKDKVKEWESGVHLE